MKKNRNIISVIFLILSGTVYNQDVHFSQLEYSPLTLNPALAGANQDLQGIVNYRTQWGSVAFPFTTFAASFDMRQKEKRGSSGFLAGGINFFHDAAGQVKVTKTKVNLSLAYHLYLDKNSTLGLALQGGLGQRGIQSTDGQWGSQYNGFEYDPSIPNGEFFANPSFSYLDAGVGALYTYQKNEKYMTGNDQLLINAGVAAFHVNRPNYSFMNIESERLYMRWSVFFNGIIGIPNSMLSIAPGIYYNLQGPARELVAGTYFRYLLKEASKVTGFVQGAAVSMGVFYRYGDAVIPKLLVEFSNYSLGISYDINTSKLIGSTTGRGGVEFFLRFVLPSPFTGGTFAKPML